MTDEQLYLLRNIIQREISYAIIDNEGNLWSYEIAKENDEMWETLRKTFEND
jgi:hypothetical protein